MLAADPHDAMLLTPRETTVVTQPTALHDRMPDMFGASVDEEALFSGIGADDGGGFLSTALSQVSGAAVDAVIANDANGAAAVKASAATAKKVYDWWMAKTVDERQGLTSAKPATAAALAAFAASSNLPSPIPSSGPNWAIWGGIAAAVAVGFFLLRRKRA